MCPVVTPEDLASLECPRPEEVEDDCDADAECSGGQRCCTNGCNLECITPVKPSKYLIIKRYLKRSQKISQKVYN